MHTNAKCHLNEQPKFESVTRKLQINGTIQSARTHATVSDCYLVADTKGETPEQSALSFTDCLNNKFTKQWRVVMR